MPAPTFTVELTSQQINLAIAVIAQHTKALEGVLSSDEAGGVLEDYLIAQSIVQRLSEAREGG
jgi:hypothetical protein